MCEYYLLKGQKQIILAHVKRDLLKARMNKQFRLRLILLLLFSDHDLEPWAVCAQRHLQQKKEKYQMSMGTNILGWNWNLSVAINELRSYGGEAWKM